REHFAAGQRLYNESKIHEALAEFRASYERVKSPNSHLYIARIMRELGQFGAAYDEYSLVIMESSGKGAKYAATKKAATEEQAALKDKVATLALTVPDDAKLKSVRVGSRNIALERASEPVNVEAGTVVVRVEAADSKPFIWRQEMKAGDKQTIVVL